VKGRKRHIVVDTLGLLLAVVVHTADVQDRDGAPLVLARLKGLYCWLQGAFADAGYQGPKLEAAIRRQRLVPPEIVRKQPDQVGFKVLPKRWIVERSFAWLGHQRRLAKDYELLPEVSEAMVKLAMVRLMLRRLTGRENRWS
jgi:putative transposase